MSQRVFVHPEQKAVMSWCKALGCWCVDFVTKSGNPHKNRRTLYGFHNTRANAITLIRKEYKLPHDGWVKTYVKTKRLNVSQMCQAAWFSVQPQKQRA